MTVYLCGTRAGGGGGGRKEKNQKRHWGWGGTWRQLSTTAGEAARPAARDDPALAFGVLGAASVFLVWGPRRGTVYTWLPLP